MKKERFLDALGEIDEKYIEDAEKKKTVFSRNRIIAAVASLVIILSAVLVIGGLLNGEDKLFDPEIDDPIMDNMPDPGDEKYERLVAGIQEYIDREKKWNDKYFDNNLSPAPGAPDTPDEEVTKPEYPEGDSKPNGEYVEVTDNQFSGIIEGDLAKTTSKYIFRYGTKRIDNFTHAKALRIYTIDGENSTLVSEFVVPKFEDEVYDLEKYEIYLSGDGKTVTVIKGYSVNNGKHKTGIISIDVSDVKNPKEKGRVSIDGSKDTTRMIGDKLYVITSYYCSWGDIDVNDPETFIPGLYMDGEAHLCPVDDIIYPEEIQSTQYRYLTVYRESDLELLSEKAVMDPVSNTYFTENHILFVKTYSTSIINGQIRNVGFLTDITPMKYSDGELQVKDTITVKGWGESQYSFDEKDGYLRFVVTHYEGVSYWREAVNASLYIYDFEKGEMAYTVDRFAPEGEGAVSVRFEGDKLYVCTAEIVTFSDPVFFFDLSDYERISYVDTGYIEGFSSSLIDMGEGYLLGVGYTTVDDSFKPYAKLEVYKREGDSVVSVSKLVFDGQISEVYKSYLIDRENNLFGLPVDLFFGFENDSETVGKPIYLIVQINDGQIEVLCKMKCEPNEMHLSRAFYRDGYVYLTKHMSFHVAKLDVE